MYFCKVNSLFLFLLYTIMKYNSIILLSIILIITLFFSVYGVSHVEGLNVRKHNTDTLFRNEYIDERSYLISKSRTFLVKLRNGKLTCQEKVNNRWTQKWVINSNGANMLILNNMGNLMFIDSKTNNTTSELSKTTNGEKLILTSYGDLELRDEKNEKIWGQNDNITEGFVEGNAPRDSKDEAVDNILAKTKELKQNAQKQMLKNMVKYYDSNLQDSGRGDLFGEARDDWNAYVNDISDNYVDIADVSNSIVDPYITTDFDSLDGGIEGGHNALLKTARKMRRKRNVLDNKVKELNQLGDSHVSEKQLHLDTTIYIGLAWTVAASGLVYYTLTH